MEAASIAAVQVRQLVGSTARNEILPESPRFQCGAKMEASLTSDSASRALAVRLVQSVRVDGYCLLSLLELQTGASTATLRTM